MPDSRKKQLERRLAEAEQRTARRSKEIKYQNDTIKVNYQNYKTAAYYEPSTGRIVRNVTSAQKSSADIRMDVSHEAKHASNAKLGIPNVSVDQFYKLQVLDETSAHIVSVLCWREEYLQAEDKKKFLEEEMNRNMSVRRCPVDYVEAIADGKINPESKNPEDFDREMALIAKGEFESMNSSYSSYGSQFTGLTRGYINAGGQDFAENNAEFEKYAKHYMTIGGVDFGKYLDKNYAEQIHVPDNLEKASSEMSQSRDGDKGQAVAGGGLVYDGTVSLEQYHKLLQHQVIAQSVIYNHERDKDDIVAGHARDHDITSSYEIFSKLSSYRGMNGSNSMETTVNNSMALALSRADGNVPDNDAAFEQKLKEIYTLPGTNVDLRDRIAGFDADNVPIAESEAVKEFMQDPEKYKREHPYERDFQFEYEHYEGEVKWKEHSDDARVSDVEEMDVFDSEGDFLQAEREKRELEKELEELKKREQEKEVKPLTAAPAPKPLMSKVMDGMRFYFKPDEQQSFGKAEIKTEINDDGESVEAVYLDGQKHGAEITKDKDGNITGLKLYDHGQEINPDGHQIDIQSKTENGKTAQVVLLDGKPFGAVVVDDGQQVKADFYDKNGELITGKSGAKISASTRYVTSPAEDRPAQEQETAQTDDVRQPDEQQTEPEIEKQPDEQQAESEIEKQPEQEQSAEHFGEEQTSRNDTSFEQEVSQTLQSGHNRIAELRAKMAAGYTERLTVGREESPAEARLRELRFEGAHRNSGTVTPTRINAQQLGRLLQSVND